MVSEQVGGGEGGAGAVEMGYFTVLGGRKFDKPLMQCKIAKSIDNPLPHQLV